MSAEAHLSAKLAEMGMDLPAPASAKGLYKTVVLDGHLAYTSGHLPLPPTAKSSRASWETTTTSTPATRRPN